MEDERLLHISSADNERVKEFVKLRDKKRYRSDIGMYTCEGIRLFKEIPKGCLVECFCTRDILDKEPSIWQMCRDKGGLLAVVSGEAVKKLTDTQNPQGIFAVVRKKEADLTDLISRQHIGGGGFFILLENLQDPGNLGTIVRSAEAAGSLGIIMDKNTVDITSPKAVRATMGSVFRVPYCYTDDLSGAADTLKSLGASVYATSPRGRKSYLDIDLTDLSAFIVGNEGNGLSEGIQNCATELIRIDMCGDVESLNAGISATLLAFEAMRQRRKK